jgi:hypothetical protein
MKQYQIRQSSDRYLVSDSSNSVRPTAIPHYHRRSSELSTNRIHHLLHMEKRLNNYHRHHMKSRSCLNPRYSLTIRHHRLPLELPRLI